MTDLKTTIDVLSENNVIDRRLPDYIIKNLNQKFPLRPYQIEAIARLIYYLDYKDRKFPSQLLFHMATGSGKTLIMAAQLLKLYEMGYRNFIYFVNNTNIIEKTKDNFLNVYSSKYLFAERIKFKDKQVSVTQVTNFETTNAADINIIFTTIQSLHSDLAFAKEDSITYEDFRDKKIAFFSDEAHHINALTKSKLSEEEKLELNSWEQTVNKLISANKDNVMLEFTATVDLSEAKLKAKYDDRLIYDYSLKQFRQDGYSKEVKVLKSDVAVIQRALQAVILSQYRRKIAEKYKLHLKPVILMKSRKIDESKKFEEQFHNKIRTLTKDELQKLKDSGTPIISDAFKYFEREDILLENLIKEIQEDFNQERCISVNSKEESEEKQIIVNTLEDKNNHFRVVFAVDKLNEGWDVLNLFDIVRLYDTRDARANVPGKTTMAEAQLIGRGARYFPFSVGNSDDKYIRKFDKDIGNEMRILEELYYHGSSSPKYIQELYNALIQTGIVSKTKKSIQMKVKDSIRTSEFWKNENLFLNKKLFNNRSQIKSFDDLKIQKICKYKLKTGISEEVAIFENEKVKLIETKTRTYKLLSLGPNVIQKALHKIDFYTFSNLSKYCPNISSSSEFILSNTYLGGIEVEVTGEKIQVDNISQNEKLAIVISLLGSIAKDIETNTKDYIGTKTFDSFPISECIRDKTIEIAIDDSSEQERGRSMSQSVNSDLVMDLSKKSWYIFEDDYGTSEEKYLIRYVDLVIDKLKEKFTEIYLVRNEKFFQIYRFSDGAAIEPDFVLFMRQKEDKKQVGYQFFIESKGGQLIAKDQWKEDFLKTIETEYKITTTLHEDKDFRLIGMPFYNEATKKAEFIEKLENILKIKVS